MHLRTARQVIHHLGGLDEVRKICKTGTRYQAWNWQHYGKFPPRTYVALMQALIKQGHTASIGLWRMIPPKDVTAGTE